MSQINNYDLLIACILSGQVSEKQIQEHLKDEVFCAYYKKYVGVK